MQEIHPNWKGKMSIAKRSGARVVAIAVIVIAVAYIGLGQGAQDQSVPADMRPLLTPRHSEMRLVATRYQADRNMLAGNYAGAAPGGRGGRGANATPESGQPMVISANRISRLKRFDMSWQTALSRLDTSKLSADAVTDLANLKTTIQKNSAELEAQTEALGQIMPLIPFAPSLVSLIEDRIAIKDIDSEKAAGTLTAVTKQIGDIQAQLTSGSLQANSSQATAAAGAVEQLRNNLAGWNTFYNGYDPLFTWWMGLPYKHVDAALQAYSTFLREKIASSNQTSNLKAVALKVDPTPAPRFNEVPDLAEILALPQDEMTEIVQRFRGSSGDRGGGGAAGARGSVVHNAQYYNDWLAALKTLDFDRMTRNAQVDYLFLKKRAELELGRLDNPLPTNNPRKTDNSGIPGSARGREGLIRDLQDELIPYTPEQLIVLADREFAWCENEMRKASREMGFGDDWKKALEKTKTLHPPPGGQPAMIRDLLAEATDYVRLRDMVTIPQVNVESQHMIMMTPERQLVNPFFTGGTQMSVSYPTDTMEYEAREQSMRGNNRPWSRATAFHEMIPGHNLVAYFTQRYNGYRPSLGGGPFYGEGWAVYWELVLYDMGFDGTPEERVGALFWRMFRCARIIFSLRFHMGQWSPQESIDFLVDRVGHERDNATAEVRRSFEGSYSPLYQAGYLLGGLQLRALRKELVDTKQMTNKAFHDEILRGGSMQIELIRLALTKQRLTRDMSIDWKFYGDLPDKD
jgi:uncharacterized protein (DUF885 family)